MGAPPRFRRTRSGGSQRFRGGRASFRDGHHRRSGSGTRRPDLRLGRPRDHMAPRRCLPRRQAIGTGCGEHSRCAQGDRTQAALHRGRASRLRAPARIVVGAYLCERYCTLRISALHQFQVSLKVGIPTSGGARPIGGALLVHLDTAHLIGHVFTGRSRTGIGRSATAKMSSTAGRCHSDLERCQSGRLWARWRDAQWLLCPRSPSGFRSCC